MYAYATESLGGTQKSMDFDIQLDAQKKVLYLLILCDLFLIGDMLYKISI